MNLLFDIKIQNHANNVVKEWRLGIHGAAADPLPTPYSPSCSSVQIATGEHSEGGVARPQCGRPSPDVLSTL
jgi:hypothetical protein